MFPSRAAGSPSPHHSPAAAPKLACAHAAAFAPRVIRRIFFALVLGAAGFVRAQTAPESQPDIHADITSLDANTGIATAKGNVRMQDAGLLLLADEVTYDTKADVINALGHITFTRGEVRLLAERLTYNRRTQAFVADDIRLGSHPYFIEGFSASGTRNEITIKRARVSYGEPGPWQPTINADTIVFVPGQQIRSENLTAGIGHTQPLPIPRYNHNFKAPLVGTATSITGGYRRSLGVFGEADLHIPVRPGVALGADLGVFTERGVMIGPSGRYENADDPAKLNGYFRSGYINDHGDKGVDILGRPIHADRAYAEWQHQQFLTPDLTLTAQANWWQDSEVVRDFRPRAFFPVQQPDTFVESVYTGGNYFVSLFGRFQPNRFHRVQERMPEVRFDLLPVAVGQGFYERFNASAAVLREDPLPIAPLNPYPTGQQRSNRFDAYYALERPIAPADWFAITPLAGARLTHYTESRVSEQTGPTTFRSVSVPSYTRTLGELGVDAVLRGSGTFDYKNPQWKIDGLRHLITPRLSYRYIPEADKGRARIPQIDREVFSTYLQPLGLGEVRNIDELHATNTLRLGLDNILQTRDPVDGTRDLLVFNVANDFRFRRRPGERDVSEIHTELALMPARWLQMDVYESFAPQNFSLREFNSGVTIHDGSVWSVRLGNNFLKHNVDALKLEDYSIDGRMRINERFEALARLRYNARRDRFDEQIYGITQNLGNTWLVSYTVRLYSGRKRESAFGFNIEIDTVRF
jgi:LPS-assembly protein